MRILLVGVGTVGEAIARMCAQREWCEAMVLTDYDLDRASSLQAVLGNLERFPVERIDARDSRPVAEVARRYRVDLVMNAVDPRFVMPIFDGALAAGVHYIDMATSLSRPHPSDPFRLPGVKLGDEQFARTGEWESAGRLALLGMGMDPGLTDVFAAHAAKHLFDEVQEVHIRDGGDLHIPGYAFAPVFSIWTTMEECLNPPVEWDGARRDWITTEPFSAPEEFPFPEGIGPVECVNVEHEEVLLVPRYLKGVRRVTFKYALGSDFIEKLKFLHEVGLDRVEPVRVRGVEVSPRDVVAAVVPDPITMGDKMVGRAIVGTWVIGQKDGKPREVFLYQMADAAETLRATGSQVVGWQTGFNPVIAMELLNSGAWSGSGVHAPEAFDPDPYLALLDRYGIHHGMLEMEPGGPSGDVGVGWMAPLQADIRHENGMSAPGPDCRHLFARGMQGGETSACRGPRGSPHAQPGPGQPMRGPSSPPSIPRWNRRQYAGTNFRRVGRRNGVAGLDLGQAREGATDERGRDADRRARRDDGEAGVRRPDRA